MTRLSRPLDMFPVIRTQSIEKMREALAQVRSGPTLKPEGRDRTLDATLNNCQLQHLGLNYGIYGAAVRVEFPESDIVTQILPIAGRGEILVGRTVVSMTSNSSAVISSNTCMALKVSHDYERLILSLKTQALARRLSALIGAPAVAPLKLDPAQNFARPEARSFRALFLFLVSELNNPASAMPPLALAQFEETLLVAFLCANRHNYSHLLERRPSSAAPWQVRRAEEYIEANWDQPIRLDDIAAVAGASARSLFRAFKQSRGYSPMAFGKQVRLRRAHQLLNCRQLATTVTEVAFACGFSDLGRFSKDYRRSFGELPSETLKRNRRPNSIDL